MADLNYLGIKVKNLRILEVDHNLFDYFPYAD